MGNRDQESLVAQLQREVINSDVPISDILRKTKILASLLKNDKLKDWIDAELEGYGAADTRPEYRKLQSISLGTFTGPFGQVAKNVPIGPLLSPDLPPDLQRSLDHLEMWQGVKEIEALAATEKWPMLSPWPAETVSVVRDHLLRNGESTLMSAWRPLVRSQLEGILAQVRNRLLDFLLELRQISPEVVDSENAISNVPSEKITQIVNNIYGNQNTVATGTNFEQKSTQQIGVNDRAALRACLESAGIDRDSLAELDNAIEQDGAPRKGGFGEHVKSWIAAMIMKAMDGTWKTALNTAPRLLQEALSRYYGWN